MNIMLFSKILALSGVGNHIVLLAEEFVKQGNRVIIVSGSNEQNIGNTKENGGGVEFIKLNISSLSPFHIIKQVIKIRRIITNNNIQVVHCHHRMATIYMRMYRVFWDIPVIYTLHLAYIPSDLFHRVMTYYGDNAIGVSSEVTEFMINKLKIPKNKIVTIFNGVKTEDLLPLTREERQILKDKWNVPDDKIILSMHSRISEIKNHLWVVEALHMIQENERKKLFFLCSGQKSGTYYETVQKKIAEYNLQNQFCFVGWSEARDVIGLSDILILPSKKEGFPLSVAEAFLMKKPVIRTKAAGFRDQKYCVPIDTTDSLTYLLRKINKYGVQFLNVDTEKIYQYARENFTVETMADKTINVYRETQKNRKYKRTNR